MRWHALLIQGELRVHLNKASELNLSCTILYCIKYVYLQKWVRGCSEANMSYFVISRRLVYVALCRSLLFSYFLWITLDKKNQLFICVYFECLFALLLKIYSFRTEMLSFSYVMFLEGFIDALDLLHNREMKTTFITNFMQ